MKQTIWRYKLDPSEQEHAIEMPEGGQITSVAMSPGKVEMWVLVTPAAPETVRRFVVVRTGTEFDVPKGLHVHPIGMTVTEDGIVHVLELV